MEKLLKKCCSLVLMVIMMISSFSISNAEELERDSSLDVFEAEVTETTMIDDVEYSFSYYYDIDGNKVIDIYNSYEDSVETLVYDIGSGEITVNDEVIATVEDVESFSTIDTYSSLNSVNSYSANAAGQWINRGSQTSKVSWKKGASVAVIAGVLSFALGGLGGEFVIAAMGAGTISLISGLCIGGTVTHTIYEYSSPVAHKIKIEWTFTASTGEKFGPYGSVY